MGYLNQYLLLLLFNLLNVLAFGAIVSVAVINIVDHAAPTNLIIYYAYTGLLSLALLLSELRVPLLLNSQARFLFTYTGRGIVLTYFGCIVYTDKLFNVIACIFTVSLGVIYFVVAWMPFISMQHGLLYNWARWTTEGSTRLTANANERGQMHISNTDGSSLGRSHSLEKPLHTIGIDAGHVGETKAPECYTGSPERAISVHRLNPGYARHTSVQSTTWPESPNEESTESTALGTDGATVDANTRRQTNDSFVYGLTTETREPDTTGDPYLDSIINSSRFAHEIMDNTDDNYIAVRSPHGLSGSIGLSTELNSPIHNGGGPPVGEIGRRSVTSLASTAPLVYLPNSSNHRPYTSAAVYHYQIASTNNRAIAPISPPMPYHVFAPASRESLFENIAHVSRALDNNSQDRELR
ncbi:hypothetical protein COEREDRAFT_81645 [Coemansia reversa NRRL 1564]|uniref:COPI associated n=1 Tax=Coemansia reversa (strain ATCC 12441 / NRRL 1564) TaxID=763665 RepID=A0A2G5BAA6_COERN|nr:hypothetical protein COEREDRAFT_81645 [Coemansia reversa NRRL 1564]|eukprot:PIA15943.1 hypothetical protein COEREDRAFT_81645 [Coemansia reversa NRRL 1564]